MPQASEELRKQMAEYFGGSGIMDTAPTKFLQDAGYTLTREWTWDKPGVTDYDQMSRKEFECLMFLCHEWDFGGLHAREKETPNAK